MSYLYTYIFTCSVLKTEFSFHKWNFESKLSVSLLDLSFAVCILSLPKLLFSKITSPKYHAGCLLNYFM